MIKFKYYGRNGRGLTSGEPYYSTMWLKNDRNQLKYQYKKFGARQSLEPGASWMGSAYALLSNRTCKQNEIFVWTLATRNLRIAWVVQAYKGERILPSHLLVRWFLSCSADFKPWRWRWYVSSKRSFIYGLHDAISPKTATFNLYIWFIVVKLVTRAFWMRQSYVLCLVRYSPQSLHTIHRRYINHYSIPNRRGKMGYILATAWIAYFLFIKAVIYSCIKFSDLWSGKKAVNYPALRISQTASVV
jgi:hypothetical protein